MVNYTFPIYQMEKAELSSDDESKENETESQPDKTARISDSTKTKPPVIPEKSRKVDPTTPLTINCDTASSPSINASKLLQ